LTLNNLDPVTRKFIESLTAQRGKSMYTLSIAEARKYLDSAQAQPVEKFPVEIAQHTLQCGPTGKTSVRIVRPTAGNQKLPVIMYFHGGGFTLGNFDTHERLVREICHGTQAAVVFVEYTPSPEVQYPVGLEQAFAATKYICEHGGDFHLDGNNVAVAGDCAGGNICACVCLLAKERGGPRIGCQVLFYPITDANLDTNSYREFADGPGLTKQAMELFLTSYVPDQNTRKQPTVSPLQASTDQLRGLPQTLVITAENDCCRDEGEAYARKLSQAGVSCACTRCLGTIHDFVMLNALAGTPACRTAINLANQTLLEALNPQKQPKKMTA
jgi:acetyl esterase